MKSKFLFVSLILGLLFTTSCGEDITGMEKMEGVKNAIEVTTLTVPDSANNVSVIVKTVLIDNGFRTIVSNDTIKKISMRPIYVSVLEAKK